MRCGWDHELRVEDRLSAAAFKRLPVCIGGSGACPPEDCGGPAGYHALREEAMSLDAMMDLDHVSGFLDKIMIQRDLSGLADDDELSRVERAAERCRARLRVLAAYRLTPEFLVVPNRSAFWRVHSWPGGLISTGA